MAGRKLFALFLWFVFWDVEGEDGRLEVFSTLRHKQAVMESHWSSGRMALGVSSHTYQCLCSIPEEHFPQPCLPSRKNISKPIFFTQEANLTQKNRKNWVALPDQESHLSEEATMDRQEEGLQKNLWYVAWATFRSYRLGFSVGSFSRRGIQ